jgi:hypothetical protein
VRAKLQVPSSKLQGSSKSEVPKGPKNILFGFCGIEWRRLGLIVLLLVVTVAAFGQYRRRGRMTSTEITDRGGVPVWDVEKGFEKDCFTFVRIQYSSTGYRSWGGSGDWTTDWPDADLNLSFRLQQLTSLKVNPDPKVLRLTDKELFEYPFIYIVEPGELLFSDEEVVILRRYLLNGGFLMVDDFWGEEQWMNMSRQLKRVLPEREAVELPLEHPIFHSVFDLKEKPQIPNVGRGTWSQYDGITWETPDSKEVHYKGIFDDKGRIMVMVCHNTDLGDGWEREGENEYYFREFSEKKAYPLGINIIFYAMTH